MIPATWERQKRIPLEIRERVWGGEGLLGGDPAQRVVLGRLRRSETLALFEVLPKLRTAERRGTIYRSRTRYGSDHE